MVRDKARLPELRAPARRGRLRRAGRRAGVGEFTLRDIIEALGRPERDPRDDLPKPIFKKGILKLEDLTAGMELKGTVLNVVDFGAFVDIGLKDSGLVHISQLANRYVKSPHDVVSVGDVVTVWVMGVDQERKRVSLTMVKPGTERQRGGGEAGPSRQGGGEQGRTGGRDQGQRGAADRRRPPRPAGSALTSPPVGAPSVAVLAEPGSRRPERDRGGPPGQGGFRTGEPPRTRPCRARGRPEPDERVLLPGMGPVPAQGRRPDAAGRVARIRDRVPGGRRGLDRGPAPRPQSRPSRPAAPPPPLSKDALAGNVPLRTFGQLKQLWEAQVEDAPDSDPRTSRAAGPDRARLGTAAADPIGARRDGCRSDPRCRDHPANRIEPAVGIRGMMTVRGRSLLTDSDG